MRILPILLLAVSGAFAYDNSFFDDTPTTPAKSVTKSVEILCDGDDTELCRLEHEVASACQGKAKTAKCQAAQKKVAARKVKASSSSLSAKTQGKSSSEVNSFFDDTPSPTASRGKKGVVLDFDNLREAQKKDSIDKHLAKVEAERLAELARIEAARLAAEQWERERPMREARERQEAFERQEQARRDREEEEDRKEQRRLKKELERLANEEERAARIKRWDEREAKRDKERRQRDESERQEQEQREAQRQREADEYRQRMADLEQQRRDAQATADRKRDEDRRASSQRLADDQKRAEQKRQEDQRASAERQRQEDQRLADQKAAAERKRAEDKRLADQRAAELARERKREEEAAERKQKEEQKKREFEQGQALVKQQKINGARVGVYSCPGFPRMVWAKVPDVAGESKYSIHGADVTARVSCPGDVGRDYTITNVVGNGSCYSGSQVDVSKDFGCKATEMRATITNVRVW